VISYIYFWALLSLVNNYAEFATGAGVGLGLPYFTWQVFLSKAAIADAIALIFGILSMVL
jgi:multisubunit Na+/H+ antiporter MnhE subunit